MTSIEAKRFQLMTIIILMLKMLLGFDFDFKFHVGPANQKSKHISFKGPKIIKTVFLLFRQNQTAI
jgi:hypothetical protein